MEKYKKIIFHIDMNSFFASCEQANNIELKDRPVIVAGDPNKRKGIVLAASYDAKACGVKTTMQLFKALTLCKNAVVVKANHALYTKMSKEVMKIFDNYTPIKQQVSIDEAFLDMTGTEHLFGLYMEAAEKIQKQILEDLNLPSSIGISSNKLLSKMASDYKKPMGITTIFPHEIQDKLWSLPVNELHGVGRKTAPRLNFLGIYTIGDLAKSSIELLKSNFGEKSSIMMKEYANGIDLSKVEYRKEINKSIGNEITFSSDLNNINKISKEILSICDLVGFRLRKENLKGKTITVKVKYNDFKSVTRSKTVNSFTNSTNIIYSTSIDLLKDLIIKPIRLTGVTITNFEDEQMKQISLFESYYEENDKKIDSMVDNIRGKYGYKAITRASIIEKNKEARRHY